TSSYCRIMRDLRGFGAASSATFGTRFGPRATGTRGRGWFCIRGRSTGERAIGGSLGNPWSLHRQPASATAHSQGYHDTSLAPQGEQSGKAPQNGPLQRPASLPDTKVWLTAAVAADGLLFLVADVGLGLGLRRGQALQALEQLFLAHAVGGDVGIVGIDARPGRPDQRHR